MKRNRNYYAAEECFGPAYYPIYRYVQAFADRSERDGWVAADPDGLRTAATAADARRCAECDGEIYLHGDARVPRSWDTERAWWYRDPREWDDGIHCATLQVFN